MCKITKRDFIAFVSTYFAVILLVLFCLMPVYWAFEQSEQRQALQEIHDYAVSSMQSLETSKTSIFRTTRNLYSDSDFRNLYYNSTRGANNTLFYDMTQLQKRLQLYYQNIPEILEVLVFLPKFDYVMTENYIFTQREQFYSHVYSANFAETQDWLNQFPLDSAKQSVYSDEFTNFLVSGEPQKTLNLSYYFPMYGDANIRMLVIVLLNPHTVAKSFLTPSSLNYGFSILTDSDGNKLAAYNYDDGPIPRDQSSLKREDGTYRLISIENDTHHLTLGIRNEYFAPIHRAAIGLVLANIAVTLLLSTGAAVYFTKRRSQPIARILHLIGEMERSGGNKNAFGEIEDTVLSLIHEIGQCKTTIEKLDDMVSNSLLEKLFFGGLETGHNRDSFYQYFGDFSFPFTVLVFSGSEVDQPKEFQEALEEQLASLSTLPHICHISGNKLYYLTETVPQLPKLLSDKLRSLRETENIILKVGISNLVEGIASAKAAAAQAERRLEVGFHIPGVFVFTHTHSSRAVLSLISVQELDSIQRALLSGSQSNADRILENAYERINSLQTDSVELRQMFFSLRSVYSAVSSQFALEAERHGEKQYHAPSLPNDLDEYSLESIRSAFLLLNAELQEQYQTILARTAKNLGTEVLSYVEEHFSDPGLCAGSIADHYHISEKYVFQLFKNVCSETLNDRISYLRVQEGIRLLSDTDLTVTSIAQKIGFTSSNTMYKVFMRVKGVSPSAYRNKQI